MEPYLAIPGFEPLIGSPLPNVPPCQRSHELARCYMATIGRSYSPIQVYRKVDRERAETIAALYDSAIHSPFDPNVLASYDKFQLETLEQFSIIRASGLIVEFADLRNHPYKDLLDVLYDIREQNHLWLDPSEEVFGSGDNPEDKNLMLEPTDEFIGGSRACFNDIFRVVHDVFGHARNGVGFFSSGEENAWRGHAGMYSREALPAMTSELRGQNCWAYFGPKADHNRTAIRENFIYAPQRNILLPEWVWDEGRADAGAGPLR